MITRAVRECQDDKSPRAQTLISPKVSICGGNSIGWSGSCKDERFERNYPRTPGRALGGRLPLFSSGRLPTASAKGPGQRNDCGPLGDRPFVFDECPAVGQQRGQHLLAVGPMNCCAEVKGFLMNNSVYKLRPVRRHLVGIAARFGKKPKRRCLFVFGGVIGLWSMVDSPSKKLAGRFWLKAPCRQIELSPRRF
jgi:hypothetical protein